MDDERDLMDDDSCQLCDEDADNEMGLFITTDRTETVWAHAQCGYDAGMDLA